MDALVPKLEDEDSGLPLLWGEAAGQCRNSMNQIEPRQ